MRSDATPSDCDLHVSECYDTTGNVLHCGTGNKYRKFAPNIFKQE